MGGDVNVHADAACDCRLCFSYFLLVYDEEKHMDDYDNECDGTSHNEKLLHPTAVVMFCMARARNNKNHGFYDVFCTDTKQL